MAIRLEERYKSVRSPHKLKGAVSGCVRECAEAQNKEYACFSRILGSETNALQLWFDLYRKRVQYLRRREWRREA